MAVPLKKEVSFEPIKFPGGDNAPVKVSFSPDEVQHLIANAIVEVEKQKKKRRRKSAKSTSLYCSDGRRKPTAAEPIRSKEDFQKIVHYLGENDNLYQRLRNQTLFVLGCSVGLRCGDLCRLRVGDVFTPAGKVKAHIELIEKKTMKRNICKIPNMAANFLAKYYKQLPSTESDAYLFASRKGGSVSLNYVYKLLAEAGKACGLDTKISTHTMRKTYAMAALQSAERAGDASNTLELLQMKLNHSDARITMRYCKAAQDKMDEMSDRVSDWFNV